METTPIEYPKITFDGEAHELKFRVGDMIRLKKDHGINIRDPKTFAEALGGPDSLENAMKVLAAGLKHAIPTMTAEEIADKIDFACILEVTQSLIDAVGKVSDRSKAMLEQMKAKQIQQIPATDATKPN